MMSNDGLRVCIYHGNDEETVPSTVQHLIVHDRVEILPDHLCWLYFSRLQKVTLHNGLVKIGDSAFDSCGNLSEINKIPSTVQVIGSTAFYGCESLKAIEFDDRKGSLPHQLQQIGKAAFSVAGPSKVSKANFTTTQIVEIPKSAFHQCSSLQTVSLPNKVERICERAFDECYELVTVAIPCDSKPIEIGSRSFRDCTSLANFWLPKGSTVEEVAESPFGGCTLLHGCFGNDDSAIITGLIARFDGLPVHKICYGHSRITAEELRLCNQGRDALVDGFGMTPLHILFSTSEPSAELLEFLFESLPPNRHLFSKDASGKRPLDYLLANWTDANAPLLMTVQKWMIARLDNWGATEGMESMQSKVSEILDADDNEQRSTLTDGLLAHFERYENAEATAILEMAFWKSTLRSGWSTDGSERQALDREECLRVSGSTAVLPNVWNFLAAAPQTSSN